MKRFISVILLMSLLFAVIPAAHADLMDEARGMLQLINGFRTGGDAWYWNRDNTTYTVKSGLSALQYDAELEATALVRADEIAVLFDHTRPDGTDCFTAFPAGRNYMGENIACGYATAAEVFEAWLEEDEDYAGQSHRRVMLMDGITRVGIAAVDIGGVRYWVQEFASEPSAAAASAGTGGWEQAGSSWYYRKADGSLVTGWLKQGGKWFLMDASGAMLTGWQQDGGNWYYLKDSGEMATGWLNVEGSWFWLGTSGIRQTGWVQDGRDWYYMDRDGVLQTGWIQDGGKQYYAGSSGTLQKGWKQIGGSWYYFGSSGAMVTGWLKENGSWYWFDSDGVMATGTVSINGENEVFGADGAWKYTQIQDYDTPLGTENVLIRLIRAVLQMLQGVLGFR